MINNPIEKLMYKLYFEFKTIMKFIRISFKSIIKIQKKMKKLLASFLDIKDFAYKENDLEAYSFSNL